MAANPSPAASLHQWYLDTARRLRENSPAPRSAAEARERGEALRAQIRKSERDAWAPELRQTPLAPELLGTLERDGYRIERLVFQTRPGCFVTANAYVPAGTGPFPAVLCVHGHWAGARRDPVVQSRCIGLAKLGFLALTLDAWGAGERGTRVGTNEYHGGLLGASLWPVGTPLHGLQLWDNVRALDYLQTRKDVDGKRLGCTGASGGGNQTTYLSAFDERVQCAVPVCSVGTFQSYLTSASCVDEVLLGGLTYAEEGDLLGLVAPRALLVITASRDVEHFGPKISAEAVERARSYFEAHGVQEQVDHRVFESGHDYNRPMREAMYGWMRRWLKGEGDGSPVPEPAFQTDDPEALRCFSPSFRPGRVMTTLRWARERGEALREQVAIAAAVDRPGERQRRIALLREVLALPSASTAAWKNQEPLRASEDAGETLLLVTEAGVGIPVSLRRAVAASVSGHRLAVLAHPGGRAAAMGSKLAARLHQAGYHVAAPELRGCGELTMEGQGLGEQIPDHNAVEWGLWIGRPLLGQWVHDLKQLLAAEIPGVGSEPRAVLIGWREAGLAALAGSAVEPRFSAAVALETPPTFVTSEPPHNQRMAAFSPDLLKVGDVAHLAALSAPRPALLAGPVRLDGMPAGAAELQLLVRDAGLLPEGASGANLTATVETEPEHILSWLRQGLKR
jgi:dienelactone hydrolase